MESITRKTVVENSIAYTVELQRNYKPCQGCNRKTSKKTKSEWKVIKSNIVTIQEK